LGKSKRQPASHPDRWSTEQAVLMSGYLGSIGFGFPTAMGAWAAAPDRPIVAVTGDPRLPDATANVRI
jgi:thiamine pyrophosphate-dependent acetolactate synthase large subunit-like protein